MVVCVSQWRSDGLLGVMLLERVRMLDRVMVYEMLLLLRMLPL
jgi:hypothetical protein